MICRLALFHIYFYLKFLDTVFVIPSHFVCCSEMCFETDDGGVRATGKMYIWNRKSQENLSDSVQLLDPTCLILPHWYFILVMFLGLFLSSSIAMISIHLHLDIIQFCSAYAMKPMTLRLWRPPEPDRPGLSVAWHVFSERNRGKNLSFKVLL